MADVNRALYWVLVIGMTISSGLFALGLAAYAIASLEQYSEPVLFSATVVLIATPVVRALVGTIAFTMNRQMRAALVAGTVFFILMFSVFLGFVLHF
ncbi:MAG: DUF1634 domain-containing protein [Conexivisphaerales archaeon]|jgi:uncharacterized membrane protein